MGSKGKTKEKNEEEGKQATFRKEKKIIWLSEYYEIMRMRSIMDIINTDEEDPIKAICVENETLKLKEYGEKRQYGPRQNWWKYGIEHLWENVIQTRIEKYKETDFDEENLEH